MHDINEMLEFNQIRIWLKEAASTEKAKARFDALMPFLDQRKAEAAIGETTEARKVLDSFGTLPFGNTEGIREMAHEANVGGMLSAEELDKVRQFAVLCSRLTRYLKRCRDVAPGIAAYGMGLQGLDHLQDEIERCIRGGRVDDYASKTLQGIRRKIEQAEEQLRTRLETILRGGKGIFSENFVSNRNGYYTLPVKKEYRSKMPGTVIDTSSTGATVFIEPAAVSKLREEIGHLRMEEENEVKIILYTLSAMVGDAADAISVNLEYMEELDYIFAKGKLSISMKAVPPHLNTERRIRIVDGRHPLLCPSSDASPERTEIPRKAGVAETVQSKEKIVPLNIEFGGGTKGVIITGPNTGGKTVALKTVGLLSVMAQCGLHVPCKEADLAMNADVFCDIGDGQSIHQNLSTFSSHIKNVIRILEKADHESLILLDELGSGTDPAEGMGIAVAVLEELRRRGCLFLVTTHYPEVKEYGKAAKGVINARMAFDRESLKPLYRLELGESGESCAFYIAKRLGMSDELLRRAEAAAYGSCGESKCGQPAIPERSESAPEQMDETDKAEEQKEGDQQKNKKQQSKRTQLPPSRIKAAPTEPDRAKQKQEEIAGKFGRGDSVMVYPQRKLGIVFAPANEKGEVGVQIQKKKSFVSYKRLQLKVKASEMYPEDYDFSIIFDTVENRKARHQMERKFVPGLEIIYDDSADRSGES